MNQSTSPPQRRRGRRGQGHLTREELLDTAEDLFARYGFDKASLRDVAGSMGMTEAGIYNHFSSKDALYTAVIERAVASVIDELDAIVPEAGDGTADPGGRLTAIFARNPNLARFFARESIAGDLHPALARAFKAMFGRAHEILEAADLGASETEISLLLLAMYNVVVGYFTSAPVAELLGIDDISSQRTIEAQKQVLDRLALALVETARR